MAAVESIAPGSGSREVLAEVSSPAHFVSLRIPLDDGLREQLGRAQSEVDPLGCNRIGETGGVSQEPPVSPADALVEKTVPTETGNARGIELHFCSGVRIA